MLSCASETVKGILFERWNSGLGGLRPLQAPAHYRFLSLSQVLRDIFISNPSPSDVGTFLAKGQSRPAQLGAMHVDVLAACPACEGGV